MKAAADHLTGDRLASAAFIELLASILLIFGCYLIGKMALLYRRNPKANPKLSNVTRFENHHGRH